MRKTKRHYDHTFKHEAVGLVMKGDRTITEVATGLGVPLSTLWRWYNADVTKKGKRTGSALATPTMDSHAETAEEKNARLEREIAAGDAHGPPRRRRPVRHEHEPG